MKGDSEDTLVKRMTNQQKLRLQQLLFQVRQRNELPNAEYIYVFQFMYQHNPLGFPDVLDYGQPACLHQVVPMYKRWKEESQIPIEELGLEKAISLGAQDSTEFDQEVYQIMEDFMEEYRASK